LLSFTKFEGFGNDYIVVEEKDLSGLENINSLIARICNRHYGAGADGIVSVRRSENDSADFIARIFNADGSEAQISGNGTRCAVAYLYLTGQWSAETLRLETLAGLKRYRLIETIAPGHYWFEAELGQPVFSSRAIPMSIEPALEHVKDFPLEVSGEKVKITAVQTGNPHCVIFTNDFNALDWRRLGSMIEVHPAFPEKTNVEFVRVVDRKNIEIKIWERGVGETLSSGTCSCGAAIASISNGFTDRCVSVHTEGGTIEVEWRESDDEIVMTGRADVIYRGEWLGE
jgi:diaminopimelate epimerase